jgi:predicted DNA-binding transcriptional regulator AlpA
MHDLPKTGYLREADLIGEKPVTPAEADRNRATGKGPKRPRDGRQGFVPFSSPTLWRRVKAGEFPQPVRLSERVTAWRVEDVRRWMEQRTAGEPRVMPRRRRTAAAAA